MGEKTGRPRGRPPGVKNKRTQQVEKATREAADRLTEVIPGAFEGDAHAFLVSVYKDPTNDLPVRIDAAKAAVRYEKPALSNIDAKVDVKATVTKIERRIVRPGHPDS